MKELDLRAYSKKKFKVVTTNSNHNYLIFPNLLERHFQASEANQVWTGDITYIKTQEGWLYLAVVLDLFSRKIVAWQMSRNINAELAQGALMMAIRTGQTHTF